MNNEICVVGIYFGEFPPYFKLWLKSCMRNPDIDFLVFTDNEYAGQTIRNVRFEALTLPEMKLLAEEKLGMKISLERPYKCCDFKPAYGMIFADYLKGYEYWGHCDFDMVFGDIGTFLKKYEYQKYDKFLSLGHLSLYRNTEISNSYFKLDGGEVDYRKAFQTPESSFFDEHRGIDLIYKKHSLSYFQERIFLDISRLYHRFRLALGDINYDRQVFFWEDGKVYRAYLEKDSIHKEEYLYIHFSMRKFGKEPFDADKTDAFFIGPEGFAAKEKGKLSKEDIAKYNKFPGRVYERLERGRSKLSFKLKRLKKKIGAR